MTTEREIRDASTQFYAALKRMLNGDARALSDVWSHRSFVTAMHPLGGRQVGWAEVRKTWEQIAQRSSEGKVELKDQLICLAGEVAYEVGVEHVEAKLGGQIVAAKIRVTNIYQREAGAWKITHHHTDMSPALALKFSNGHSRHQGGHEDLV
jgi:ketosteroid isomerase-like protein